VPAIALRFPLPAGRPLARGTCRAGAHNTGAYRPSPCILVLTAAPAQVSDPGSHVEQIPEPVPTPQDQGCISVSTTFNPKASLDVATPDTIFVSSDNVYFWAHSHRLASDNAFGAHFPALPLVPIPVPEPAAVFNLMLHVVYGLSFAAYMPSLRDLCATVDGLKRCGVIPRTPVAPGTELYEALLAAIVGRERESLEVYALAAAHDLHDLATAASRYLHALPLSTLTDADARRMGPVYLRKLFFLHLGRVDALKRLLTTGPVAHAPTSTCGFADQSAVTRAWSLGAAYLGWCGRAGQPHRSRPNRDIY
jgi:hypothetical protein